MDWKGNVTESTESRITARFALRNQKHSQLCRDGASGEEQVCGRSGLVSGMLGWQCPRGNQVQIVSRQLAVQAWSFSGDKARNHQHLSGYGQRTRREISGNNEALKVHLWQRLQQVRGNTWETLYSPGLTFLISMQFLCLVVCFDSEKKGGNVFTVKKGSLT